MKPNDSPAQPQVPKSVCCEVAAYSVVKAAPEQVQALRQSPGPAVGKALPASFLKHADEQTVVGITAVRQAIHRFDLGGTSFTDWAVLAAPRFLGRSALAAALQRFASEGAWGISPHLIPHRSLHSLSGTISQALQIHGPNFGVGGGPGCATEIILAAAALLESRQVPGAWVVLTSWDPEPVPNQQAPADMKCQAVALAMLSSPSGTASLRLRLVPGASPGPSQPRIEAGPELDLFSVEVLLDALAMPDLARTKVIWQLDNGDRLEMERCQPAPARLPAAAQSLAG